MFANMRGFRYGKQGISRHRRISRIGFGHTNDSISKLCVHSRELSRAYGGETGIRTLDTLRYTRFPSVRLQPLGHPLRAAGTLSGFQPTNLFEANTFAASNPLQQTTRVTALRPSLSALHRCSGRAARRASGTASKSPDRSSSRPIHGRWRSGYMPPAEPHRY